MEISTNSVQISFDEYDHLIKAEERLRILEEALKRESKGDITSGDFVKVADCVLNEAEPPKASSF